MDEKMKAAMKGIFDNLTDEQKAKAKACKSNDELMKLAGEWGIELPEDVLDAVAGGESCLQCPLTPMAHCEIVRGGDGC